MGEQGRLRKDPSQKPCEESFPLDVEGTPHPRLPASCSFVRVLT
jgi:hypothetical protein